MYNLLPILFLFAVGLLVTVAGLNTFMVFVTIYERIREGRFEFYDNLPWRQIGNYRWWEILLVFLALPGMLVGLIPVMVVDTLTIPLLITANVREARRRRARRAEG